MGAKDVFSRLTATRCMLLSHNPYKSTPVLQEACLWAIL